MKKSNLFTIIIVAVAAISMFALIQINKMMMEPKETKIRYEALSDDIIYGDIDAPLKIIEFASFGCSHCQKFYLNNFPKVKERFIDTGKAVLIYRHLPLDGLSLTATTTTVCYEGDQKKLVELFYTKREDFVNIKEDDMYAGVFQFLFDNGIELKDSEKTCTTSPFTREKVGERVGEFLNDYNIQATPTLIVGDMSLVGNQDITTQIEMELGVEQP